MNRATRKCTALATTTLALGFGLSGLAAPAGALGSGTHTGQNAGQTTGAQCKGETVKPKIHADALRREATLTDLVAKLSARQDPYGLNGAQISTLQAANTAIVALDGQIASSCYATTADLRTDATKLFVDYRVYWLRAPQTHVIEAADRLAEARVRLGNAAAKLAPLVGSNAAAQADLAAMNAALGKADALLGTPPAAGPNIAPVAGLAPAADMSADTGALQAGHADLLTVRSALVEARAAGLKVVTDLHS